MHSAHRHKDTRRHVHTRAHPITFRKLTACSWAKLDTALLVHLCSFPPPLSSSLWLPRTRRPSVQWDIIYHHRNNYWRRFIVRKFQAILRSSRPLYLPSSVVLSCPPAIPLLFLPSSLSSAFLHGSQWAMLQVRLPLAQAHHCRLQCRVCRAPYYILSEGPDRLFSLFLTMGASFFPREGMGKSFWYYTSSPVV